ncbi:GL15619 [Drosophila persimilis]|uniref:GL15619 n=1 Tax=Drosophila persimilis TaxID=7234 RepID=B4HAR9_DROPE|nr:GL15619 [Drosophila persimilis]
MEAHRYSQAAQMAERTRRWGIQFDGQDDPLSFIELLEEHALSYGIDTNHLPRAIAEILIDRASRWFRTSTLQGDSCVDFRQEFLDFFLPPRYFDQIRARNQATGELLKDFIIELRLLMHHAGYDAAQELNDVGYRVRIHPRGKAEKGRPCRGKPERGKRRPPGSREVPTLDRPTA